ncbi:MAG: DUF354 domain-containing protein [Deltaproteobacteria bacterium]|nr:DUF354 domain-containing protein [Deltaproteobacteria bacterium]MBW2024931.1 DUF354 domain-containing protein [Deltaproteobacteria bacterium]MBW2124960.1 DUF354 domain-containing protein [Deltaproteobacteria bacterium]
MASIDTHYRDRPKNQRIWIDLDNSPHVPFFRPIIEELEALGHEVILTARDCFQVCELADYFNMAYKKVGRHYGKNKILKVAGTLVRACELFPRVLNSRPGIMVSHGSRSGMIAAAVSKIPILLIADYEFAELLPFVKPARILTPDMVSSESYGRLQQVVFKYPGIKEDVYVPGFKPNPDTMTQLGLDRDDFVVTIRPPATEAHYHNPESEILFDEVVNVLCKHPHVRMVILPRNETKQTGYVQDNWPEWCENGKIIIPDHVVNGLDLIWFSDFVISGGGTMNREAAALEVPVYSIFRGKIGAVDRYLSQEGRLTLLQSVEDVHTKMRIERRKKGTSVPQKNRAALDTIVKHIIEVLEKKQVKGRS